MSERPILFSAPMVRAILAGRKTQTRRIVKMEPWIARLGGTFDGAFPDKAMGVTPCLQVPCHDSVQRLRNPWMWPEPCRLWVKETFCVVDDTEMGGELWTDYRATPRYSAEHPAGWDNAPNDGEALKWKPSIFMPRALSRITLEITDVRAERLGDISEADAYAEGYDPQGVTRYETEARGWYVDLWNKINGEGAWAANPWVWAVSFRVLPPPPQPAPT